ncbi:MAG: tetratricopeptide repeat protein [bacterium]|nr:tetratricopeptide repeat protein [bacterium]
MQYTERTTLRRCKTGACAGLLVLALLLSVLGGCVTTPKEQVLLPAVPPPSVEVEEKLPMEPTVERLDNGREGFVITEGLQTDVELQEDFDRAVTLLKDEDYDRAIALLEKVIARSPGVTAPYIDLAIAYGRTGRLEQAEENLKAALELFPGHPVASNEYGLLYRQTGRFAEARAVYEKAIARFPDYYPVQRNLGILCDLYLGDPACALEHYEIYSEANPEAEQVKLWVADLRARLGHDEGGE